MSSVLLQAQTSRSAVADAAMAKDNATVRQLLKGGTDANAAQGDGMTALHWAALNGDAAMTEMLLVAGANLRATTRSAASRRSTSPPRTVGRRWSRRWSRVARR